MNQWRESPQNYRMLAPESHSEALELRRCVRDLVALSALPAMWKGCEPGRIAESAASALVSMLGAEFVYVGLSSERDDNEVDVVKMAAPVEATRLREIAAAVKLEIRDASGRETMTIANPLFRSALCLAIAPIGFEGIGVIVAGAQAGGFPTETQRLLLITAADKAALGLHRWQSETAVRAMKAGANARCSVDDGASLEVLKAVARQRVRHCGLEDSMSPRIHQATAGGSRQFEALAPLASISRCSPGQQICRQGEPADRWFWIIAGSARRSMIRPDGRRQIIDFLFPGDCFGFTNGREYDDSVDAIARETYVARCVRRNAEAVAETNPQLAGEIRRAAFEALWRLQSQLLIVGRVTAFEKVGAFLIEMAARLSSCSNDRVVLPISRYDIADYLGLSVETVSRSLTHFKQRGVIKLFGPRSVWIVDRRALERGERATQDEVSSAGRAA